MDAEQLKRIKERLDGATPDLRVVLTLGGDSSLDWPRGLWQDEQVVNRDIRFHNTAYADVKALLAEVESLQSQRDQAERRSRTWHNLYKSKRQQNTQLMDTLHELSSQVTKRFGIPFEAANRTFQAILLNVEEEDRLVERMEAIEDVLKDPILRNRGWLSHQAEENGQ